MFNHSWRHQLEKLQCRLWVARCLLQSRLQLHQHSGPHHHTLRRARRVRRVRLVGALLLPLSPLGQNCLFEGLLTDDDRKRRLVRELTNLPVVPDCETSQEGNDVLRLRGSLALLTPRCGPWPVTPESCQLRAKRASINLSTEKNEVFLSKPLGQAALNTDQWVDNFCWYQRRQAVMCVRRIIVYGNGTPQCGQGNDQLIISTERCFFRHWRTKSARINSRGR